MKKGDRIIVFEKKEDGWWKGKIGKDLGWFLFNYVFVEENLKVVKFIFDKLVFYKVRILYNFDSKNFEEFSFKKDEILDIIEKFDDDFEWWVVKKSDGFLGLVFSNYIVKVDNEGKMLMLNVELVVESKELRRVILF